MESTGVRSTARATPVDVVIITVRDDEYRAVLERIPGGDFVRRLHRTYKVGRLARRQGEALSVAVIKTAEQGTISAQITAQDAIDDLHPRWLVLVGIAGALPDQDIALGDVVVASRLHAFTIGALDEKGHLEFADQGGPLARPAEDLVASLAAFEPLVTGWNTPESIGVPRPEIDVSSTYGPVAWQKRVRDALGAAAGRSVPRVHTRPTATSPLLVKNARLPSAWRGAARDVAAVEMELAGVYAASRRDPGCPVVAIRGISDIVGLHREPAWTTFACNAAAAYCVALLRNAPPQFLEVTSAVGTTPEAPAAPSRPRVRTKAPSSGAPRTTQSAGQAQDSSSRVAIFSGAAISDTARRQSRGELIRARAVLTTGQGLRRPVKYFVSYAHDNEPASAQLVELLGRQMGPSMGYSHELWGDWKILVGQRWRERIDQALEECDFGLLLVSPEFLASDFITATELPWFVSGQRPVIPVALAQVSFKRHDLKGLDQHQIFFSEDKRGTARRSFAECGNLQQRRRFGEQLFEQIEARLDEYYAEVPMAPPPPQFLASGHVEVISEELTDISKREAGLDGPDEPEKRSHIVPPRGSEIWLGDTSLQNLDASWKHRAVDALDFLVAWATDAEGPPYAALLGEYGIGKTTTLEQLTRRLLDERQRDPSVPLPIFVDLRRYVAGTGPNDSVPSLRALLDSVIEHNRREAQPPTLRADDILEAVRNQGALIVFDGLDEKLVHLDPGRAREFIRELLSALPAFLPQAEDKAPGTVGQGRRGATAIHRRGKLLLSCRSHYFKDIRSQNQALLGQDRLGREPEDYKAFILLPFDEGQILDYLSRVLGDQQQAQRALELFAAIHNLRELAARPYLLSLMAQQVGSLEELRARGGKVLAATLYEQMVDRWLERDAGKHHLSPTHKLEMMASLAADMWRDGARTWPWDKVEGWLDRFFAAHPAIIGRYGNVPAEVLNEDFRTATFVLRGDESPDLFRFAHTSLQEYFLAHYLWRGLQTRELARWNMAQLPSPETLAFLGQLLELNPDEIAIRSLEALLEGTDRIAARLACRYWVLAEEDGYPVPSPSRADLSGLDLEGWTISGRGSAQPFRLRGANLANVRLAGATLTYVDLSRADFTGADLERAEFQEVDLSAALFSDVACAGAVFHSCEAIGLRDAGSSWRDSDWLHSNLRGAEFGRDFRLEGSAAQCTSTPLEAAAHLIGPIKRSAVAGEGHTASVWAAAWSPDGSEIVSGGSDRTLRVWDARSGRCRLTLEGHSDWIRACAWSPNGNEIVSGGADRTLRVWDARSGRCRLTLEGHSDWIRACAWSPDGNEFASGGEDRNLRIWDRGSGKCRLVLQGHSDPVWACAWSPDGSELASGGADGFLYVWDTRSGSRLGGQVPSGPIRTIAWSPDGSELVAGGTNGAVRVLDASGGKFRLAIEGHSDPVLACAWSPEGNKFVSGGTNESLSVWDSRFRRVYKTLRGHSGRVLACAWSPDGSKLASCGADHTVRIWDDNSGECRRTLQGHSVPILNSAFSPDGKELFSGSADGGLRTWDSHGRGVRLRVQSHAGRVLTSAWSSDASNLVSGGEDGALRIWDTNDGKIRLQFQGHSGRVLACAWSPDGTEILSSGVDRTLRVWDARSGKSRLTLQDRDGPVWSPRGGWAPGPVWACAWAPDGARLVSGGEDRSLRIWHAGSGRIQLTLQGHTDWVLACAWAPDGRSLASGSADSTLRIWDTRTATGHRTLRGHSGRVHACAWSPDGGELLSGAEDGTVKVWDAQTGRSRMTLLGHLGSVLSCAWSPDGSRLLSGGEDGSLRLWDAYTGRELARSLVLDRGQEASFDTLGDRFSWASSGAWRFLGWRAFDPEAGRVRVLPVEYFGPLPSL